MALEGHETLLNYNAVITDALRQRYRTELTLFKSDPIVYTGRTRDPQEASFGMFHLNKLDEKYKVVAEGKRS